MLETKNDVHHVTQRFPDSWSRALDRTHAFQTDNLPPKLMLARSRRAKLQIAANIVAPYCSPQGIHTYVHMYIYIYICTRVYILHASGSFRGTTSSRSHGSCCMLENTVAAAHLRWQTLLAAELRGAVTIIRHCQLCLPGMHGTLQQDPWALAGSFAKLAPE